MSNLEGFPSQEDWEELWDESASDTVPGFSLNPSVGIDKPIEPDWDALLED